MPSQSSIGGSGVTTRKPPIEIQEVNAASNVDGVTQWLECLSVEQEVVGSNPISVVWMLSSGLANTKSIGCGYTSALIPSPSPQGRRELDSKSLSPRERDLG
jgi:hypothetical protein